MSDEENKVTIECVPITDNDRYVFMLKFPPNAHHSQVKRTLEGFHESLSTWWESGEKFGTFVVWGDLDISLERIEDERITAA